MLVVCGLSADPPSPSPTPTSQTVTRTMVFDYAQAITHVPRKAGKASEGTGSLRDTARHVSCHLAKYPENAVLTRVDVAAKNRNRAFKMDHTVANQILHVTKNALGMNYKLDSQGVVVRDKMTPRPSAAVIKTRLCYYENIRSQILSNPPASFPVTMPTRTHTETTFYTVTSDVVVGTVTQTATSSILTEAVHTVSAWPIPTNLGAPFTPAVRIGQDEFPFASSKHAADGTQDRFSFICVTPLEGFLQGQVIEYFYGGSDNYNVLERTHPCVQPGDVFHVAHRNVPPNLGCNDVFFSTEPLIDDSRFNI